MADEYRYSRYRDAMDFVFGVEGRHSDDPDDAGGETMYGVTIATLRRAHQLGLVSHECPKRLTTKEALVIYFEMFWKKSHAFEMPTPLDLIIFDIAVNSGPGRAIMILQEGINDILLRDISIDGGFGPQTRAAMEMVVGTEIPGFAPLSLTLSSMCLLERVDFYDDITDGIGSTAKQRAQEVKNRKFLRGWIRRAMKLHERNMVASHG